MKLSIKPDRKLLDMIYKTRFMYIPVDGVFVWRDSPNVVWIKTDVTVQGEDGAVNAKAIGADVCAWFEDEDKCMVLDADFEKEVKEWMNTK